MTKIINDNNLTKNNIILDKKLVVFIHGYGSNGDDLVSLCNDFKQILPNSIFLTPNAPFTKEDGCYQWFLLDRLDEDFAFNGILNVYPLLKKYLDDELIKAELQYKDLILIGFSQGGILATHMAFNLPDINSVISFSGGFVNPNGVLNSKINPNRNICFIHGVDDDVLPYQYSYYAYKIISKYNKKCQFFPIEQLSHSIDNRCIKIAKKFIIESNTLNND